MLAAHPPHHPLRGSFPTVARLEFSIRSVPFRQRRNRLIAPRASDPCLGKRARLDLIQTYAFFNLMCGGTGKPVPYRSPGLSWRTGLPASQVVVKNDLFEGRSFQRNPCSNKPERRCIPCQHRNANGRTGWDPPRGRLRQSSWGRSCFFGSSFMGMISPGRPCGRRC